MFTLASLFSRAIRSASPGRARGRDFHRVRLEPMESRVLLSAATQVVFGVAPGGGYVGTSLSPAISVKIEDISNQVVLTDHSIVTLKLASAPAGGKLLGTLTVNAVNGMATFNTLSFSKPGNYTLEALDGSFTITSASFTISPAPFPASLQFLQQPTGNASGSTLTSLVKVEILDQYGHVFNSGNPTLKLKILSGPAGDKLLGITSTPAINGIATFTGLSLNKAGTYTLQAVDGLFNASSSSFTVAAPVVPTSVKFLTQPAGNAAGSTTSAVVQILDQYGDLFTAGTPTLKLQLLGGPGGGKLLGVTSLHAVNGVAGFSGLSLNKAGSYQLEVFDGALHATSSSFTVANPIAATSLSFSTEPGGNVAGSTTIAVVHILDQYGHVFTAGNPTISLSIHSGGTGSKLLGTTHIKAENGSAIFGDLSLNQAGTYVLSASDGPINATSSSFTVANPAVATSLFFLHQPATVVAGVKIASPVVVEVQDQYGALLVSDHSTIKLTVGSGPQQATFSAPVIDGEATFPAIAFTKAGSYTLHATDGILAAANSSPFTVSPAAPASLIFTQVPTSAAHAGLFTVKVSLFDKFGNLATGGASNVTLTTVSAPTGAIPLNASSQSAIGIAVFSNLTFSKAGTYQLKATDGALTAATSTAFTLT